MAKKPDLKKLQTAAKELNKILKPEPPIKFVGVETVDLVKHVKMAGALLEEGDEVTKGLLDLLLELEIEVNKSVKVIIPKEVVDKKEEVSKTKEKETKKDPKKKKTTKEKAVDEALEAVEKGKVVSTKKNISKKATEVVKELLKKKYTRSSALVDSLKVGGSKKELIEKANQLYVKNGGSDKVQVANALLGYVMPSLLLLEIVEVNQDVYSLRKG